VFLPSLRTLGVSVPHVQMLESLDEALHVAVSPRVRPERVDVGQRWRLREREAGCFGRRAVGWVVVGEEVGFPGWGRVGG